MSIEFEQTPDFSEELPDGVITDEEAEFDSTIEAEEIEGLDEDDDDEDDDWEDEESDWEDEESDLEDIEEEEEVA
jgi:RNA polymerase primary sigma factor